MSVYEALEKCVGFDWDDGNQRKNWEKHRVSDTECEAIFFNQPLIVSVDPQHSKDETRYFSLGQTDARRLLLVAFTLRNNRIRVISARDMTEQNIDEEKKANPGISIRG